MMGIGNVRIFCAPPEDIVNLDQAGAHAPACAGGPGGSSRLRGDRKSVV